MRRHAYRAKEAGQLSLSAGDVIECDGDPDDNWQYGHNRTTGEYDESTVAFIKQFHMSMYVCVAGRDGFHRRLSSKRANQTLPPAHQGIACTHALLKLE